jgi:hypothetical protein
MSATRAIRVSLLAFTLVGMACKTDVTDSAPYAPVVSKVLGTSPLAVDAGAATTEAILVDDTSVTWLNEDGSIYTRAKSSGAQATLVTTTTEPIAQTAGGFGWYDSQAVVAQGTVYFVSSLTVEGTPQSTLQSCPLTGCATPTIIGPTYGTRVVTDGDWLAYERPWAAAATGTVMAMSGYDVVVCQLPGCTAPEVALHESVNGQGLGTSDFALANGTLWFVEGRDPTGTVQLTLAYCKAGACAAPTGDAGTGTSAATSAWQPPPTASGGAGLTGIVGATASAAFVTASSGELLRCDLPTCANPVDVGIQVRSSSVAIISGNDMYVASKQAAPTSLAPASWMHCSLGASGSCFSTAIPYPDPALAEYCATGNNAAGSTETFGNYPFAVDASAFYWATDSIYANPATPGNMIVSTAR